MTKSGRSLRWGVEQRLEFIEFNLFWEGGVNRSEIMDFFGVSAPQASTDLGRYQEMAPDNLRYDNSHKRYFTTETFEPRFLEPKADEYLTRQAARQESEPNPLFDVAIMPIPHRRIDVSILRTLLGTIREETSIEILYQSMNTSRPEPIWRRIAPHAFANDGLRWHTRAYCFIEKKYKDFILSRILDVRAAEPLNAPLNQDNNWIEFFDVILQPNPLLSESQQNVIAHDYSMTDNLIIVRVRRALLYYFEKRLRLDVAEHIDDPKETPVVIANKTDFKKALEAVAS